MSTVGMLRDLEAKATPGPWEHISPQPPELWDARIFAGTRFVGMIGNSDNQDGCDSHNAALIASMRNALPRLLSMLQPPSDAAVLEAVRYFDDLRGEWSDEQLEVHLETLLDYARAETPRLTREQKESALHLLSEMDKMLGEDMQPDDERPAALAMQRFCAAFPELGE